MMSRLWSAGRRFASNEAVQVGALLLLALLVRLAFHFRSPALVGKDSQSYFLPGWELARAQPFEIGQRRTPGYPLFIAGAILTLGEDLRALALAQHVLGVATVAMTYLLGKLTFGRSAGLLAGLLVALSGPLLIYERYVMSEALFGLLLGLAMLAGVVAVRRAASGVDDGLTGRWRASDGEMGRWGDGEIGRWLLAGLALGLAILTRPIAQMLIPLLALSALLAIGRDWRRGLLGALALVAGVALIQGPWVLRNALTTGNVGASTFGRTLIARTAYYDRGFAFDVPGQPHPDPMVQRAREIVQEGARRQQSDGIIAGRLRQELDLDPLQVNRLMRDVAVAAILRDPVHYVEGSLNFTQKIFVGVEERLRDHWDEYKDANPWDERVRALVGGPNAAELAERPTASRLVGLYQPVRSAPVLAALFALGLAMASFVPRYRAALLPGMAAVLLLLASAALDGPVERYRYPVEPLISLLAAGGLTGGLRLMIDQARRSLRHPPDAQAQRATTAA